MCRPEFSLSACLTSPFQLNLTLRNALTHQYYANSSHNNLLIIGRWNIVKQRLTIKEIFHEWNPATYNKRRINLFWWFSIKTNFLCADEIQGNAIIKVSHLFSQRIIIGKPEIAKTKPGRQLYMDIWFILSADLCRNQNVLFTAYCITPSSPLCASCQSRQSLMRKEMQISGNASSFWHHPNLLSN